MLLSSFADRSNLFVNSMPIRVSNGLAKEDFNRKLFGNRGVNGIDGTLGTAIELLMNPRIKFLLTGDLALLRDSNAFCQAI